MSAFADSDPTTVVEYDSPTPPAPETPPVLPPSASPGPPPGDGWQIRDRQGNLLMDITNIAMDKTVTRRLNRPSYASFRIPSYMVNELITEYEDSGFPITNPILCTGYRQLSVTFPQTGLFFYGIIWTIEESGDEDMVYSQVTAYDPMMLWRSRPARDLVDSYSGDAGNLIDPSFLARNLYGGPIMQEILLASENSALVPAEAEGPLNIDLAASTFTGGGADLSGAPTNWPMTIAEIASLLTNTGELDIVLTPIFGGLSSTVYPMVEYQLQNLATVATYNGNYGADLTDSVHFDYAIGDYNARLLRRSEDMSTFCNKIFYYLGPRLDQKHWRSNVTGDHPDIPVDLAAVELLNNIVLTRERLGIFMEQSVYDNFGTGDGGSESSVYWLFVRQWLNESFLRNQPRSMAYITPVRDGEFGVGDFDIGDLVSINIGNKARVTESGAQRIYQYTIDVDDDGVEALGEFVASPDQDDI